MINTTRVRAYHRKIRGSYQYKADLKNLTDNLDLFIGTLTASIAIICIGAISIGLLDHIANCQVPGGWI